MKRKRLVVVGVCLAVLLAGAFLVIRRTNTQASTCDDSFLKSVVPVSAKLDDTSADDSLAAAAQKITTQASYQSHAGCMYIATLASIKQMQTSQAKSRFDTLQAIPNAEASYSAVLGKQVLSLAQLKVSVAYVQQREKAVQKNSSGVTP